MMKTYLFRTPRFFLHEAIAIYDTVWSATPQGGFKQILDEIADSLLLPFSLEIYTKDNFAYVCFSGEEEITNLLRSAIYSLHMDADIEEFPDFTHEYDEHTIISTAELKLARPDIFPLEDWKTINLSSITPIILAMAKPPQPDRVIFQLTVRPVKQTIMLHVDLATSRMTERAVKWLRPRVWLKKDLALKTMELLEKKALEKLYWVNLRVASLTEPPLDASPEDIKLLAKRMDRNVDDVVNGIKIVNTVDENQIVIKSRGKGIKALEPFQKRSIKNAFRLSTMELSTLWFPPRIGAAPMLANVVAKKGAPPKNIPHDPNDPQISIFGITNYREARIKFGIKRADRRRHMYLVGKSGTGKSCLLQLLVKNDIEQGFGCAVLDPHGDLVDDLLKRIPRHRIKDVVIFDPSDFNYPPSFNPLNAVTPELKMRVTIGFIDIFKQVLGADWSEKMDHVIRYAMLALLNIPTASILSLRQLLADDEYRAAVLEKVYDESVRRFWELEFVRRREEFEAATISPILNRLDQLLAQNMIRNILGQPLNLFNFREFMDSRKIVLMKVSKGLLGAENATLLGSMVIAKIYEAAMSRADVKAESRPDFYLYVDEFQNFANESFGEILSESRKYGLCLTFANQYLGQLSNSIRQTVFGNVANILAFRVGGQDADVIAAEFKPRFMTEDVLNLALRDFYLKMSVDGETQEAFSGRTLDLPSLSESEHFAKECIEHSRSKYALPLAHALEVLNMSEFGVFQQTPKKSNKR